MFVTTTEKSPKKASGFHYTISQGVEEHGVQLEAGKNHR